jgi:hypothetical protein
MTSPSDSELLTIEEFAQRYRVGRSTVFLWISSKKMIQGVHYFKIGKTVRIPWSMELLAALSTIECEKDEASASRSGKNNNIINLDY